MNFGMALANHHLAPEIEMVSLITSEQHTFLSSTTVREVAFTRWGYLENGTENRDGGIKYPFF